ncbi:permease [Coriobacteriia bacterium Es71-Z0120]|uniref:permease n=1 Tax=Parvivirga hydrogeniphila TaxID=2939460 RepID=UPI002260B05F|nr:permease [Parvivirga hydrogeniphila]MCL4078124.1 permease [Parvivirga hydrogeniphila]
MDVFAPLQWLADWITFDLLGLAKDSRLGSALSFFLFDVPKILILLSVIVFVVAIIRSFFPPEKTRKYLSHSREYVGNVLAALLGVVTPFCSCSAVPLFIGFVESGVPLGVTFSFLIASPMVNEVALILLFGMFGWKIAALYLASGLSVAIVGGIVMGRLGLEDEIEEYVRQIRMGEAEVPTMTWAERIAYARGYVGDIVKKVWPYIVVGIAIGGFMHGYIPADALAHIAGPSNPFAVPVAVAMGIPLYSNAAGVIPLVSVLTEKGVAMGTVLAFMMAVTALSLPEFIILRKVMKPKLIAIYAAVGFVTITATGYLFNWAIPAFGR